MSMRVRFAPSPTGHLHVGNARTALFNWLLARHAGGTFILRIEDTDVERSTGAAETAIYDDLRWLGLEWDEGPDKGGPHEPYRQSERVHLYQRYAAQLLAEGHAYHCFCSPELLERDRQAALAEGRPPRYAGTCRTLEARIVRERLSRGERAAVRFIVPEARQVTFDDVVRGTVTFTTDVIGDPVILRSDGYPAYNFAVVVDDATMGVTHVVRGEDHVSNTPRQLLIYEALGLAPPVFAHLALVLGPDHAPLSKRHGATSVAEFRERGYLPEALFNYLALIGWSPGHDEEILPAQELARRFRLEDVGRSAGVFDESKLAWVNRHYLKAADPGRLAMLLADHLRRAGRAGQVGAEGLGYLESLTGIVSTAVDRLDQAADRLEFLFGYDAEQSLRREEIAAEFADPTARGVVHELALLLEAAPRMRDRETFRSQVQALRGRTGQKGRALLHPVRVALTGELQGPELDLVVPAIDRGADLSASAGLVRVDGCRERASAFSRALRARFPA
jgi:glutamyl-tRNA synthetase/nondiscriminating glutamyl-tRNA synthetase